VAADLWTKPISLSQQIRIKWLPFITNQPQADTYFTIAPGVEG